MEELRERLEQLAVLGVFKMVMSKPTSKSQSVKKIVMEKRNGFFQFSKYTEKQVFHDNVSKDEFVVACLRYMMGQFRQLNAWDTCYEYIILLSANGRCTWKRKALQQITPIPTLSHDRKKNYILTTDLVIPPLVDMGIFTKDGKVVKSMYDKYKQINRFLEIIDDAIRDLKFQSINVIDFGCGKSYLTFIIYYYLTYIKNIDAHIIGLDLKKDVIQLCNEAAERYGYDKLHFELGDINGYQAPFPVDLVITLHACDTATDFALYNAISWNAKLIFSVPCCQHELNSQIQTENYSILTRYGIVQERFSALATDAIRGNLLEYCGYRTQLMEFVDLSHTPKNILIRAVKKDGTPHSYRKKLLEETESLMEQFHFSPTLYRLLMMEQ